MTQTGKPWRHLLAVVIGILPLYGLALWMHLSGKDLGVREMLLYPLLFGGGEIFLIWQLLKHLCGERLQDLNLKAARIGSDIGWGLGLFVVLVLLAVLGQFTIDRWFPREPNADMAELVMELSSNPLLMLLWLGPVVWIGVAFFEELSRVFLLTRLWKVWPGGSAAWIIILFASFLFGFVHVYQGTAGVISVGLMSLIKGWFYLRKGRLLPLIIAHGLYDSGWIIFGIVMIRRGML